MRILAIDPGTTQSAWLLYEDGKVIQCGIDGNDAVLSRVKHSSFPGRFPKPDLLAIEMIESFGKPVGREVFETCVWIGRFVERFNGTFKFIYRKQVKLALCNDVRAKDPWIRQALIDRYGPGKAKAIGTKKAPGPLYGISKDIWSALAVAVVAAGAAGE